MAVKFGCLLYLAAICVGFLEGSVLKVDLDGAVKKKDDFKFCIASDACRVFFCLRSL